MKLKQKKNHSKLFGLAVFIGVMLGTVFILQMSAGLERKENVAGKIFPEGGNNMSIHSGNIKKAIFAGGCFWCMEYVFEELPGVIEVVSGYTGGKVKNPTYEQVSTGKTGHYESVLVRYDPTKISYERLLEVFWKSVDPTDAGGQFYDRGSQYKTAIFYIDDEQRQLAEESKRRIEMANIFGSKIVTDILPAKEFYSAEEYHQDYYKKCPLRFESYHKASGRESFTSRFWKNYERFRLFPERQEYWLGYKKPSREELKKILSPLQYRVT
jgi:peptide methionine sulfoxide reductase msrA/msrB